MDSTSITVNREWLDKLQADKAALEQRAREVEAALRLYANEDNWASEMGSPILWQGPNGDGMVGEGGFEIAAKALADGDGK